MAALCGWEARELHNHPLPLVVLPKASSGGQEGLGVDLGEVLLAHLQRDQRVDRFSQPSSQKQRLWSEDHKLPFAQKEPVAQLYGAQVGTWQARGCGVQGVADGLRVG